MHHPPALIRLAIISDYALVVAGLEHALSEHGMDFVLVGKAELHTADVVLYDPFAHNNSWVEVDRLLGDGSRVVVFGWQAPDQRYFDHVDAGLLGFLSKTGTVAELTSKIQAVATGDSARPGESAMRQEIGTWPGKSEGLSAREAEVMAFVAQGLSNQDIAAALFVSVNIIETHVRTAYSKAGVTSRTQAVMWAIDHGLGAGVTLGQAKPDQNA